MVTDRDLPHRKSSPGEGGRDPLQGKREQRAANNLPTLLGSHQTCSNASVLSHQTCSNRFRCWQPQSLEMR